MTPPPLLPEEILPLLNQPMPFSDEAEKGTLSCLLQDPSRITTARTLPPMAYYRDGNRIVYDLFIELYDGRTPLDPIIVTQHLRTRGLLEKVGGAASISEIFTFVPIPAHFSYYHKILADCYQHRQKIAAHARALHALMNRQERSLDDLDDEIKGILDEASHTPGQHLKSRHLKDALYDVMSQIEERLASPGKLLGWSTGLSALDRFTNGMQKQHVWVLAGEPGDGKSTLLQNAAETAAGLGAKVRWYPLEMPDTEQAFRMLCSDAEIANDTMFNGMLSEGQQGIVEASMVRLSLLGVHLVDVDGATATDIFTDIERSDCDIAVVDYLQLMEDQGRKGGTREEIIAGISRRMKRLAKRSGKCILTASQLNDNGKLRESRAIGQDADKVLIIQKFTDGEIEGGHDDAKRNIFGAKNRGGKRGWTLPVHFSGATFKFREFDKDYAI